jgi:hypothetical protein
MCPWFVLLGLAITGFPEKQVSTEKKRFFSSVWLIEDVKKPLGN